MKGNRSADVVIVGGGASGLAAAVELRMSSPELSVLVIEKMKEPGRKLRATGSGRCNITNTEAPGFERIMEFFDRIVLATRIYENGLVYPYSESAADVAELLVSRAETLGAGIACGEEVIDIRYAGLVENDAEDGTEEHVRKRTASMRFTVESKYKDSGGEHTVSTEADYVILATGGKAGPSYGTTGDGYRLARELGHSIVTPVPVLTGIECLQWDEYAKPDAHMLAGTRADVIVSLYRHDFNKLPSYAAPFFTGDYIDYEPEFREDGEIQFTRHGLSGICIFNMTRHMRLNKDKGESFNDFFIKVNLYPDGEFAEFINFIKNSAFAEESLKSMMCTMFKKPIADYISALYESAGYDPGVTVAELSGRDIMMLCEIVHGLEFAPTGLRGWKDAQATSGGVSLDEIDEESAESLIVSGLYITGELADIDLPCGGFNLSNAWLTGLAAADDIAKKTACRTGGYN